MKFTNIAFLHGLLSLSMLFTISSATAQVVINEIMPANLSSIQDEFWVDKQTCPVENCNWWFEQMGEATRDGDYPDWIEIYNGSGAAINLNGYGLSDNIDRPYKWVFPSVTLSTGERLVVFASGKDITNPEPGNLMHTNFKIDKDGETLLLTNSAGAIVDQYAMGAVPPDFSCGRYPDGSSNRVIFQEPSPQSQNGGVVFTGFFEEITTSHAAGFRSSAINVTLSSTSGTAQIRYTTDGSEPNSSSSVYSTPINISSTTVLKARGYDSDAIVSKVITKTFFIGDSYSLPVVSLSTHPDNFWDDDIGIYVHGSYPVYHERIANYWQNWERPVTLEFFEADGQPAFTTNAGVKILGWGSRANDRKSLSVFFRDRYGQSKLEYPMFDDLPFTEFKALVLRAAGGDWQSTLIRDVFASDLIKDKNIDHQRFRPAIVFINGEYWGIHNIREKLNEDYLDLHYDIDKDRVDMISRYWRSSNPIVIEGTDSAYLAMENYVANNNMNADEAYDYVKAIVDLDNLVDYLVPEIYYANYDWPGNNIKCWKPRTANSQWRWLFYDLDYAMNSHPYQNDYTHNTLAHATADDGTGWPNTPITTLLIREILEGNEFRNAFVNRMADYINSRFIADTSIEHLETIQAMLVPEMQDHIDRWDSYGTTLRSISEWNSNIDVIKTFFENRSQAVKDHILDFFSLNDWDDFTMDVSGQGKIKVNSIIPSNYPWTGQYVEEIPITLTALPEPGYEFTGWDGLSANENSARVTVLISEVATVTANFTQSGSTIPYIVINEVNYNSSDEVNAGDWIELYNPYASAVDISGWIFKDEDDLHEFVIPANTIMPADGYLVLCRDSSDFEEAFPAVNNYIGEFDFGLSSSGETLRLYNNTGDLIDSFAYSPSSPWPHQPNGFGPTLSLLDASSDNSLPSSWGYSIAFGTPGAENNNYTYIYVPSSIEEGPLFTEDQILLEQNYPNPFASVTYIPYYISRPGKIILSVIDIQGKEVDVIYNGYQTSGYHTAEYITDHLPHGIYYYRLQMEDTVLIKRMVRL